MNTAHSYTISGNIQHFVIAAVAANSPEFRRVLWTGEHAQIVVMTIPPGGEIGAQAHPRTDQAMTVVSGSGEADLAGETHEIDPGDLCAVPAGTQHNLRNTGEDPLVLYTICSPPEHAVDAVYATRSDADAAEGTGATSRRARNA